MTTGVRARPWLVVLAATSSTTLAIIPPSLVGALAVLLRQDIPFDESALGVSTAVFFAATAGSSVIGGRVADRFGAGTSMLVAGTLTGTCMLALGLAATEWWHILVLLGGAGVANGLAQPGCNLALAAHIPALRQGAAFGVKQGAIPLAGLVAGMCVPTLGLTLGWRAAFTLGGVAAVLVVLQARHLIPTHQVRTHTVRSRGRISWRLVGLAVACGLGTSAGISMTAFIVPYAVESGTSVATAGWLLALGGGASVVTRVCCGRVADRFPENALYASSVMLLMGTVPLTLLAFGVHGGVPLVVVILMAFTLGWGWPGLFAVSVVWLHPSRPASASGITQAGGALGGVLGPLVFGAIAVGAGYRTAWTVTAACAAAGALAMWLWARDARQRESVGVLPPSDAGAETA